MKAIVYEQYGPPNVLELRDIAKPVLIVSLHLSVAQDGLIAQVVAFRFRVPDRGWVNPSPSGDKSVFRCQAFSHGLSRLPATPE